MLHQQPASTLFILTIDTEEEWQWDGPFPQDNCQVENVQRIPQFQSFCEEMGIRPTYFVDYAVAANPNAVKAINQARQNNHCEIGAHLHPWCNPPYFGQTNEAESHVVNLPLAHIEAKLDELMRVLTEQFNTQPKSFRTGRWGIDSKVLTLLAERGFRVDSSVYPFYRNEYFSCEGSPLVPYWPDFNDPLSPGHQRQIMEIPVTAGFNRRDYGFSEKLHRLGETAPLKLLHTIGLLWHSRLLRKIYLSPELNDEQNLCMLVDTAIKRQHRVIHMYLHSSSLIDGATGFFEETNSLQIICQRIRATVEHLQRLTPVEFCTITEACEILNARSTQQAVLT
ncbi:polysaccharide deacetylase family protein [Aestuariibacter sp. GS-14]|uniref:polysaccharide deacetylase family protein n=1 Tax=Aestuariibacter sp. GS-14 TaxID=2590670 RepID=UPI002104240A|nr:polysaccharide deacetylase family protein [Aestuariibacter sp. GS-14]